MKKMNDLAVFIMVHGRPDKMWTYHTLRKSGYTGRIFLVADNLDPTVEEYKEAWGDELIIFDKKKAYENMDSGDNTGDLRSTLYSANTIFEIAREKNIPYFFIMCDDYRAFYHIYDREQNFKGKKVHKLDQVFGALLDFYKTTDAHTIAFAQTGDFIGGKDSQLAQNIRLSRKAMNTFLCSIDRPFQFIGRLNEDVTTYVNLGGQGKLFLTIPNVVISQLPTQKVGGGLTDVYLDYGTYTKSFFSVMYNPSCVSIGHIGTSNRRIHHKINWGNAVPKIINQRHKKILS